VRVTAGTSVFVGDAVTEPGGATRSDGGGSLREEARDGIAGRNGAAAVTGLATRAPGRSVARAGAALFAGLGA
jgi:hypothetical protein